MKFVNLNSAFLIGVMALTLNGCASNGDGSSSSAQKRHVPVQSVTAEAQAAFEDALVAIEGKQYDKAEKMLQEMTKSYPNLSGPYLNLGILYIQQNKSDDAIVQLEKAVEVNPGNIEAYNQLAWAYREKAEFKKAEETYLQGLAQNERDPELNYNLGVLYDLLLQNPDKALYYYQQYLENIDGEDEQVQIWIKDLQRRS